MESSTKVVQKLRPVAEEFGAMLKFQPPEGAKLDYPCILVSYKYPQGLGADNIGYMTFMYYQITVITKQPDTKIVKALQNLPRVTFNDRVFISNNLYHYVLSTYENL